MRAVTRIKVASEKVGVFAEFAIDRIGSLFEMVRILAEPLLDIR